ncbi:aminodeoxychorismate synthase component I [uncultured Serinicoccus sp.]|uniref:aminodeoxychorismate synthase component I n=1 Tax=uncultured Serinicoccus sp. TaxID=735514 RepID=UPI0026059FE1|nr:aminodeoxychorismate synthase component I [uncultured Serinicoccus sp.]
MAGEVLLIDHLDSFTYNLADLLHRVLGRAPVLWRHDHPASAQDLRRFAAVVIGPGPGRPQVDGDLGLSALALRQREVPVLGVCLGHQGLAHVAGETVAEMSLTRHGIVSPVEHDGQGLFEGVPSPLQVVRYHSLEVVEPLRSALHVTARAVDDGCVMALADPDRPFWGVQFHPESVLSEHGERVVANFLALAGVRAAADEGGAVVAVGDTLRPQEHRRGGRPVRLRARLLREDASRVRVLELHERLVGRAPSSVWLDSSDGSGWSVLADGRGPLSRELTHRVGEGAPLLDRVDAELDAWALEVAQERPGEVPWRPGLVGWIGYEVKAETGADPTGPHRSPWPDAWLLLVDRGVVLDHRTDQVWAVWVEDASTADEQARWVEEVVPVLRAATEPPVAAPAGTAGEGPAPGAPVEGRPRAAAPAWAAEDDEAGYLAKVRLAQAQIARGESYEICLTTAYRTSAPELDEGELYRALREVSPVPRGAWLRAPGLSVLSGSPERFVSVDAGSGAVEARPIKGTRPRGDSAEHDAALAADLATAVKDRAENLMIVDLLRNDLHRVCRSGSVHVPQLCAVETYATVHQLVSTVRGTLAPRMGPTDVLRACFPGGSMTGAPKVRTMEILDELEGRARGVYSGTIGWIGLDGSMDTSIVIRTLTRSTDGALAFGVGGAVTALSHPAEEYAETRAKAQAMLRAVDRAAAVATTGERTGERPGAVSPAGRDR